MTENANPDESRGKQLYKQGFAAFAKGEVDDAIARYREAIAAAPGLAIAWNGLSLALAKQGRLEDAIEAGQILLVVDADEEALARAEQAVIRAGARPLPYEAATAVS